MLKQRRCLYPVQQSFEENISNLTNLALQARRLFFNFFSRCFVFLFGTRDNEWNVNDTRSCNNIVDRKRDALVERRRRDKFEMEGKIGGER